MSTSPQTADLVENAEALPAWKQEVSARLSAHRNRRGGFAQQPALPGMEPTAVSAREPGAARVGARVAARVAERYAKAPSYGEVLAAEAAKAARAAEAAAQAAQDAHEAAQAVTEVLWAGMDADLKPETVPANAATQPQPPQYHVDPASLPAVRHRRPSPNLPQLHFDPHPRVIDPFEEALVAPAQPLPARVLEFPRELVATRKARPRIAEGPLRDEGETQLRIFEVDSQAISRQPSPAPLEDALVPEWSSIRLDPTPRVTEPEMESAHEGLGRSAGAAQATAPFSSRAYRQGANEPSPFMGMLMLHVAPIADRVMAAIVDVALVSIAFLLFVLVFVACTPRLPLGKPALIAAGAALAGFVLLYHWLFFTFAESTPGMRYAKIALCTFEDENPDRQSLQRRIGACLLSALPLGLGFLWVLLDEDRLGWHDRMTRTYQRSYR